MKKKTSSGSQSPMPKRWPLKPVRDLHRSPHRDLFLYAHSFHKAAKTLAAAFQPDDNVFAAFDASPVVFLYSHAVELHLKAIILGEGGNFLATKPDPISVQKTHSVSWLAQFVCQIVMALGWEKEFTCEGVQNLADFKTVVEGVNSVDPGSYAFRCPVNVEPQGSAPDVREFVGKMDALLELLASTADALAATWDMREETPVGEDDPNGGGFEPTIQ